MGGGDHSAKPSEPPTDEQMQQTRQRGAAQLALMKRLLPLVGPRSEQNDMLLTSQRAQDIANACLIRSAATGAD